MQRYGLIFLILFLLVVSCNQYEYRDNTDPFAKLQPDSITRIIKSHISVVDNLRYSNPDSALLLINETERMSKALIASNDEEMVRKGYRYLGESLNYNGVINSSLKITTILTPTHFKKLYNELRDTLENV